MCGKCQGEQYKGVRALFNGDTQSLGEFNDRRDWLVISPEVIVHLGSSALKPEENYLYRGCEANIRSLDVGDSIALVALGHELSRPPFGRS